MMKKIIAGCIVGLCLSPAWAATPNDQSKKIHSLIPADHFPPEDANTAPSDEPLDSASTVKMGGFGGNARIGKFIYDGVPGNKPSLNIYRSIYNVCYMKNDNVKIYTNKQLISFNCSTTDPAHHNLYWDGDLGNINEGYSPVNDVLYASDVVTNMFHDWYGIPPYVDRYGLHERIIVKIAPDFDNAYIKDDGDIVLGTGASTFYPLTSLGTVSYFTGELFTWQHAHLGNNREGWAIEMAFNCMTAMATESYATGNNTWQVGSDITKNGAALHYMDQPSKDCGDKQPGDWCSIDYLSQDNANLNNFFASGLYNRVFYSLATTADWSTQKAYEVFLHANRYHWNGDTNFHSGACGAVQSAQDLGYNTYSVMLAFSVVGIDTRDCTITTSPKRKEVR